MASLDPVPPRGDGSKERIGIAKFEQATAFYYDSYFGCYAEGYLLSDDAVGSIIRSFFAATGTDSTHTLVELYRGHGQWVQAGQGEDSGLCPTRLFSFIKVATQQSWVCEHCPGKLGQQQIDQLKAIRPFDEYAGPPAYDTLENSVKGIENYPVGITLVVTLPNGDVKKMPLRQTYEWWTLFIAVLKFATSNDSCAKHLKTWNELSPKARQAWFLTKTRLFSLQLTNWRSCQYLVTQS